MIYDLCTHGYVVAVNECLRNFTSIRFKLANNKVEVHVSIERMVDASDDNRNVRSIISDVDIDKIV